MNTVKATVHEAPPPPPVKNPEDTITLTMPRSHAETLASLLMRVGGSPFTTRRRYADRIGHALEAVGVAADTSDLSPQASLYFSTRNNLNG
jgi:hypothetical protein